MMERLTEHEEKQLKNLMRDYADSLRLLAQYEDLEEQGLLVRLPCKVGDTVYGIYNVLGFGIETYTVAEITYDENGTKISGFSSDGWVTLIQEGDFGKNVFLTREEAETAALRKMQQSK